MWTLKSDLVLNLETHNNGNLMEADGCDVEKVKGDPDDEFELLRLYFYITNINNIDFILQGFHGLNIISFIFKYVLH